ncbi:MAG: class I SAM-dependent methyltransferase [Thermoleophilaceae bacterium]|nr:class I SAM-dependent methyltransferase [Thermoleophilaceae bacterium]
MSEIGNHAARKVVHSLLGRLGSGQVVLRERDEQFVFGQPTEATPWSATITVHDMHFYAAFVRGSLGLAESYSDGEWDCDDLVTLTRIGARNMPALDRARAVYRVADRPLRLLDRALYKAHLHKEKTARHYNTGNELFEMFLDETMAYSCGVFESDEASLQDASTAKFDRICRKLELGPDLHVLEFGTGWGGFAIHAASNYGCRVTSATISHAQLDYARQRVREAGVEHLVELVEADFAAVEGSYDRLVSVEMIESIGWRRFDEFFAVCGRLLKPDGAMMMQAITIDDSAYEAEKYGRSFMNTLIFPGGSLPSNQFIANSVAKQTDMRMVGFEDLTSFYPITLQHWRERFAASAEEIEQLGYDLQFRRLWDLYLAYCAGGFLERRIMVGQTMLAKPEFRSEAQLMLETGRGSATEPAQRQLNAVA